MLFKGVALCLFFAFSANQDISQVQSYLLVKDYENAIKEAKILFEKDNDRSSQSLVVSTLAKGQRPLEAIDLFLTMNPSTELDFELYEAISWSIIDSASYGGEWAEVISLIGASTTSDIKGLKLFMRKLNSTSPQLRALALRLSSRFPDTCLKEKIQSMIANEVNYFVRLEAIQAAGRLKIKEAIPLLESILLATTTTQEERALAIYSYTMIFDTITDEKLAFLLNHPRAPFRELALEFILQLALKEKRSSLKQLIQDSALSVRIKALMTYVLMCSTKEELLEVKQILPKLQQQGWTPLQEIMTSWIQIADPTTDAKAVLKNYLLSNDTDLARIAAAMVVKGGFFCEDLLEEGIKEAKDRYVRLNLAMGMIKQGKDLKLASDEIIDFLLNEEGYIMTNLELEPLFPYIAPSKLSHVPHIPRYPLVIDQITRLELVGLLAVANCKAAKEVAKHLLLKKTFAVTANAAIFLLKEGDLDAIDLIRQLIDDEDERVALQALLVLAFFAEDHEVRQSLINLYPKVQWEAKIQIIEALGKIGGKESLAFLLKTMKESSQVLRVASSASMIQCLYH